MNSYEYEIVRLSNKIKKLEKRNKELKESHQSLYRMITEYDEKMTKLIHENEQLVKTLIERNNII